MMQSHYSVPQNHSEENTVHKKKKKKQLIKSDFSAVHSL